MNPLEYLRAIRRRWVVLLLSTLVMGLAGWALSERESSSGRASHSYSASAIILSSENRGRLSNLDTLAALVKVGTVPERVARRLDRDDPVALGLGVQTTADDQTGLLTITARSPNPEEAELIANAFANELLAFAEAQDEKDIQAQLSALSIEQEALKEDIAELEQQVRANPAQVAGLEADLQLKEGQLRLLEASALQLSNLSAQSSGAQVIQEALAVEISRAPGSGSAAGITGVGTAAILGLLLGMVFVVVLERFDTRIRTKRATETHFRLPVLTEIPQLRGRQRRSAGTIAAIAPCSLTGDAYRLLAAGIGRAGNGRRDDVASPGALRSLTAAAEAETTKSSRRGDFVLRVHSASSPDPKEEPWIPSPVQEGFFPKRATPSRAGFPQTILVVSPGPREGKTTVVSNLAASFSDMGKKTLVLSCDFHRPAIHEVLRIPNDTGLAEAVGSTNGAAILDGCVVKASIETIDFDVVPTGTLPDRPAELLTSSNVKRMLAEARQMAEVVIIDTPPILSVSDATALLPYVDSVVVVARAGKTTAAEAHRTSELLLSLGAPAACVALNRARELTIWSKRAKGIWPRRRPKAVEKAARPA